MKLGCLTYMDEKGVTQVLAVSIIRYQDSITFGWVFHHFRNSFGSEPVVCFTDSDEAMASAIKGEWPSCQHLLCTFHLFKNFTRTYTRFS
jgi:MULE transposase domain